jgi:transposase-like protein
MSRKPRVDRSPEEKWQIIQEGIKSGNVSETCRRHSIAPNLFYRWKDEAEQGAKAALGGRSAAAVETEKDHRIRQLERTLGRKSEIEAGTHPMDWSHWRNRWEYLARGPCGICVSQFDCHCRRNGFESIVDRSQISEVAYGRTEPIRKERSASPRRQAEAYAQGGGRSRPRREDIGKVSDPKPKLYSKRRPRSSLGCRRYMAIFKKGPNPLRREALQATSFCSFNPSATTAIAVWAPVAAFNRYGDVEAFMSPYLSTRVR